MEYEIAIATRNRLDTLKVSLPLFLSQTRRPNRIIVVDASDDHAGVYDFCRSLGNGIPIDVIYSEQRNLAHQRNIAIELVKAEVLATPDDDSFWFPDTAENLMKTYEKDSTGLVGMVTALEVHENPVAAGVTPPVRKLRLVQHPSIARLRNRIEDALVPRPFNLYGRRRITELSPVALAHGLGPGFVETVGGFRMSMRTKVAKELQFDATLGSRVGYSTHEDIDFSLRTQRAGYLLMVSRQARVFHAAHPGNRAAGFAYGFFHIFNYAYICAKVLSQGDPVRRKVLPYLRYKAFLYGLRQQSPYLRQVFTGSRAALTEVPALLAVQEADLPALYASLTEPYIAQLKAG